MKAWFALGTLAALSILPTRAVSGPPEEFRLSDFSGTWVGKHTVEQVGQCRGPGESAVILTVDVTNDGRIEVRSGGPRLGVGTVSAENWKFTLRQETFARCRDDERRYERELEGAFRKDGDDLRLDIEGELAPCPPRCVFIDRYQVTKRDVEALVADTAADRDMARTKELVNVPPASPVDQGMAPAVRATTEDEDQIRKDVVLQVIAEAAARKTPDVPFAPLAYCVAVDATRDYGDPEPSRNAGPGADQDLFMKGPRDNPSDTLMAALRATHPSAKPEGDCPEFDRMRPDWWHAPLHVLVRRPFWMDDSRVKVPVMTHRTHSGCYNFKYYVASRIAGGWTIQTSKFQTSLCY
jgi:hypothetical protein